MDIALIHKDSGLIENVISAESIEDAQEHYPDLLCIIRGDLQLEPGGTYNYISGEVKRAPIPEAPQVDPKDELIAALMAKLGM